jgi:hypothetical protein
MFKSNISTSFSKMKDRKVKTGPVWGLAPVGGGGYKERV